MLSNSIENIVQDYEFLYKRIAYLKLVKDSASEEIENNKKTPHRAWKAQEAYDLAVASLEHAAFEKNKIDQHTRVNGKYIQGLCSLTFDNDKGSEHSLTKVVEKFTSILSSTRKEPLWLTMAAEGIKPTDEDYKWFKLLFKREVNPEYTLNHKVSQIDNLHTDAKRMLTSCSIVVQDLSTRVRFTYADSPDEPMANTYIFYWMYGEGNLKDKLATSESAIALFKESKSMLPLGIGLTEEQGYLVKSVQMGELMSKFQEISLKDATFEVKPGRVYGGWSEQQIIKANGFKDMQGRSFKPGNRNEAMAYLDSPWNQWLNTKYFEKILTNYNQIEALGEKSQSLPELTVPSRIIHSYVRNGYFQNDDKNVLESLSFDERKQFDHGSSQYFSPNHEYGFFAYPVNRGNFKTKNLLELAKGDKPVALRVKDIPIAANEDEQPAAIALHCTLPEWDRRISNKLDALNISIDLLAEKVKAHTQNIERLTGMSRLVSLQQKFPYGIREQDQIDTGKSLLGKIDLLAKAIGNKLEGELEEGKDNEFVSQEDIDDIETKANALWHLIQKKEFLTEINNYFQSIQAADKQVMTQEGGHSPGPYMEVEPYWGHIIETLTQCLVSLDKTQLSDNVWAEWVAPLIGYMCNQPENLEAIENISDFSEFIGMAKAVMGLPESAEEPEPVKVYRERIAESLRYVQDEVEASEQVRQDKAQYALEHWNPLLWVFSTYKDAVGPLFHRVPGAPSLMQQVIDLYSDRISNSFLKKGLVANIKFNMAVFRLADVADGDNKKLPKSFINKMALLSYIAESSPDNREAYTQALKKLKKIDRYQIDKQIKVALDELKGRQNPTSDVVYNALVQKWYKTLMFTTTVCLTYYTWATLSERIKDKDPYSATLLILEASAGTLYSLSVANGFSKVMWGVDLGASLAGSSKIGQQVARLFSGEAMARRASYIGVLISLNSAKEQYDMGNEGNATYHLAVAMNTAHVQLAYAAQRGIGSRVVQGLSARAASAMTGRVAAIGLSALVATVAAPISLFVASAIAASFVIYEVVEGVQAVNRTGLFHMFKHYLTAIDKSQIPILNNKYCHELYTGDQLPEDAQNLYDDIKDLAEKNWYEFEGYAWQGLSWRAAVPLYIQGFSISTITAMIILPEAIPSELTQRVRDDSFKAIKTIKSVGDIIAYYENMAQPQTDDEEMPSGRKKIDIAKALAIGEFIPAQGHDEELTIIEDGRSRIISFDHLYFREPAAINGVDWDELKEKSQQITYGMQHV